MAIRQILLVAHTHHDVGYTNSPRIIDRMHAEIVDRVIDLADADASDADAPDAFRWTFEAARPVLRFLAGAAPTRRDRLISLVRSGRLAVTGGQLNMTQLPGAAEYDAAYRALGPLRDAGIAPRTQQHGDVNGISWGTVDQMRDAGITRLVMALNPDHGRPPFTQPSGFRWRGPTGRDVFVWLSTHYGFGEEWGIVDGDVDLAERRISAFVDGLGAREDYRWSTAVVHAGNDNRWPTARYLDVIRDWNARHPDLPMRSATMDEALDELERENGTDLPVFGGEWADWWAHGHGSTAREVAVYREARTFQRQAQSALALARLHGVDGARVPLAEVLGYRRGPVRLRDDDTLDRDLAHVDEQLLLYAEHTWGSWETYSAAHSNFTHSHHNATSGYAYDAFDHARDLAIEGWFRAVHAGDADPGAGPASRIVALNGSERARREIVDVEVDGSRRARALVDAPAFGSVAVPTPEPGSPVPVSGPVTVGRYRVEIDPARGGIVSLVYLPTGRELVDPAVGHGLGAVITELVPPGADHPMLTESPKLFHPDFPGPAFERRASSGEGGVELLRSGPVSQLVWRGAVTGIPGIVATLTVADDHDDVDLDVWLTKPERFGPESVFVAFPFLVPGARFLVETAGAVFEADAEQLPDTSKDWYSLQHAVGVVGDDPAAGVLWGTRDAPLVQLGGIHTGAWARELDVRGGQVNSWLMNNLHFTNFPARQEVTRTFRYRLRPAPGVTAAHVRAYGRDLLEPLQARHHRGPLVRPAEAPLRIEPRDALLVELAPAPAGEVRVTLRNPGGAPVVGRVELDPPWEVVAAGDAGDAAAVDVPARGSVELVVRPRPVAEGE
ncbi:hypothetical protein [Microbacterium sp. T2.11-28]|uniref:glycoside hydrolase family 38 N-terminal domain-containing protein n=1 Tax=Microbacterium sp. T2.11-28 TaxID=3041169 RepID=UPI002477B6BD|nr:hypothetical protein [Microbacterium sp. T2.11-28]CAI9390744.1 hypothetical protein MICABA_01541 [Microbacterium sp. T2.11-28]